jgi:antitoxin (DNA-binding transcriptional repressor) of toxin-antitoxin stability system
MNNRTVCRRPYSTARQRLAEVLEEASRDGEVQIRRQDGRVYAVTPVAKTAESPFANVTGRPVKDVTSKDLLRAVREEGPGRGARTLRSARQGRVPRGRKRAR